MLPTSYDRQTENRYCCIQPTPSWEDGTASLCFVLITTCNILYFVFELTICLFYHQSCWSVYIFPWWCHKKKSAPHFPAPPFSSTPTSWILGYSASQFEVVPLVFYTAAQLVGGYYMSDESEYVSSTHPLFSCILLFMATWYVLYGKLNHVLQVTRYIITEGIIGMGLAVLVTK